MSDMALSLRDLRLLLALLEKHIRKLKKTQEAIKYNPIHEDRLANSVALHGKITFAINLAMSRMQEPEN